MTTAEILATLKAAPSDDVRARLYESLTEEQREELDAHIAYEEMCDATPRDALQAQVEVCVGDAALNAVLANADPDALRDLDLQLKTDGMNTAKAAALYMTLMEPDATARGP